MNSLEKMGEFEEVQLQQFRVFLEASSAHDAVAAATRAYEEVLRLRAHIDRLEKQMLLAELRSCEKEMNVIREHTNVWATLMLCVKSGVRPEGFAGLTELDCRKKMIELQTRSTAVIAHANVAAERLGYGVRVGMEKDGKVYVRLSA